MNLERNCNWKTHLFFLMSKLINNFYKENKNDEFETQSSLKRTVHDKVELLHHSVKQQGFVLCAIFVHQH